MTEPGRYWNFNTITTAGANANTNAIRWVLPPEGTPGVPIPKLPVKTFTIGDLVIVPSRYMIGSVEAPTPSSKLIKVKHLWFDSVRLERSSPVHSLPRNLIWALTPNEDTWLKHLWGLGDLYDIQVKTKAVFHPDEDYETPAEFFLDVCTTDLEDEDIKANLIDTSEQCRQRMITAARELLSSHVED